MNDSNIVERLARLERQSRCGKWLGAFFILVITALLVTGQAMPGKVTREIQAERFVLNDGDGRVRATLGFGEDEHVGLTLYDKSGKNRIWLGVWDKNQTVKLSFRDQNAKDRIAIGVSTESSLMIVYGKDGKANLMLDTLHGGNVSLIENGELRGQFGAINGDVGISLYENDRLRARLGLNSKHDQELKFLNEDGNVVWSAR